MGWGLTRLLSFKKESFAARGLVSQIMFLVCVLTLVCKLALKNETTVLFMRNKSCTEQIKGTPNGHLGRNVLLVLVLTVLS